MIYEIFYKEPTIPEPQIIRRSIKTAAEQLIDERGERSAIKEAGDRAERLLQIGQKCQGRFWHEVHAFLLYACEPLIEIAG